MEKKTAISKLKEELSAEILKENSDSSRILSLSNELASMDDSHVRFSIDAGLIDRLGRELVARQETAVSELVKNAYDADSTHVKITFNNSDSIGGDLTIQDDGEGMNKDELLNGFMRISSTDKMRNPYSRKYGRRRAGQKGIGRFAVQRLGSSLTIITQTEEGEHALQLTIDWDDYKGDLDLTTITNTLKIIPKIREKGTTLLIRNLREKWGDRAIARIYNYVSDIIQPYKLKAPNQQFLNSDNAEADRSTKINNNIAKIDPGFRFEFIKITSNIPKTITSDITSVYNHALAVIEGYVDDKGQGVYTIKSEKLDINEIGEIGNSSTDQSVVFDKLRNIKFIAYYFIYESDLLPAMHSTSIKKMAQTQGGIRLYRNGFRVLPYGEANNDWLSLDASLRTRSILPSHGNNNFFGFVELSDFDNNFSETSSREGLVENDAFIQLQNFVHRTILKGVIKVAELRNIKLVPSQKKDEQGNWEKIEINIKNIAKTIEELENEDDSNSGIDIKKKRKTKIKKLKNAVKQIEALQKEELQNIFKEKSMLRVLSSVGLTIAQFIHEIKYYIDNIQSDIRFLSKQLPVGSPGKQRVNILDANFASFHTYTSYFDAVVSQNVIRELRPLDLRTVVNPFISSINADALKSGIEFVDPVFHKYRVFTKPMHPSEWSSILFNFYTNSKKAIKRAAVDGKIFIECGEENDMLYLEFSDNGDGISQENEDKVFDEFFTTTAPGDFATINNSSEILGTGLGLKIVKDTVDSYRGTVRVVSPKANYSTTFRVEVPKSNKKDLEKYGL